MTVHTLFKHHDTCPKPGACMYCDGGLAWCTTCGGAEADLPTECPGRRLTPQERDNVAMGLMDYVGGVWVHGRTSR